MERVTDVRIDGFFVEFRAITREGYEAFQKINSSFVIEPDLFYSTENWKYQRVQLYPLTVEFDTIEDGIERTHRGRWDMGYVWDVASVPEKLRGVVGYDHPAIYVPALFHDSWYQKWFFEKDGKPTENGCRKANLLFKALIQYFMDTYFHDEVDFDFRAYLGVAMKGFDFYKDRSAFDLAMSDKCVIETLEKTKRLND